MMKIEDKIDDIDAFAESLGKDPCIRLYIFKHRKADSALWYKTTVGASSGRYKECIMILPYLNEEWTEDKIAFDTLDKAIEFCNYLSITLERDDFDNAREMTA
jgi:hypothetical protein